MFRYNISDETNVGTQDILEFVPVTTIEKKLPRDIISNEIPPPEKTFRLQQQKAESNSIWSQAFNRI